MTTPKDLVESQLPSYFLEQYPQFTKFVQEYYSFLDSTVIVLSNNKKIEAGDVIYGSLSKAKGIVKVVADDRIYFDYITQDNSFHKNEMIINGYTGELYIADSLFDNIFSYIQNIEKNNIYETSFSIFKKYFKNNVSLDHSIFQRLDPKTLTKRILDYYKNKGTENSFYWFFRIFFDEDVEFRYPKVDILKLSDSGYYRQNLVEIEFLINVKDFIATRISTYENQTVLENGKSVIRKKPLGVTAVSRQVISQTRNSQTRIYLDLTYINGEFKDGDQIIAYDMITGEEKVTGVIKESIVGFDIIDGGIGHTVGENFHFDGGRGEITKVEKYSITKIDIVDPGLAYQPGDRVNFRDEFANYTHRANVFVDEIETNDKITEFINSQNNFIKNAPISLFETKKSTDPLYAGGKLVKNSTVDDILPSGVLSKYEFGGIKSLRWEDSGLNYGFAPSANVVNQLPEISRLNLFGIHFDNTNANTANLEATISANSNTVVTFSGASLDVDALFVRKYMDGSYYYGVQLEDEFVSEFLTQRNQTDIENDSKELSFRNENDGTIQTISNLDVVNVRPLNDTAVLETSLGDGIADYKILEPGLSATVNTKVKFSSKPKLSYKSFIEALESYKDINNQIVFPDLQRVYDAKLELENSNLVHPFYLNDTEIADPITQQPSSNTATVTINHQGNGANTVFDAIYANDDVTVQVNGITLVKNVDYTIESRGHLQKWETSDITFTTAPTSSDRITFYGKVSKYLYVLHDHENRYLSYQSTADYFVDTVDSQTSIDYYYGKWEYFQKIFSIPDQYFLEAKVKPVSGILHPPYEEFRNNQSMLSSDKYFFDNDRYQWYSYEIYTKIPLSKIKPLLLDELHPAGFKAFVENKFEDEFRLHVLQTELPEIEIESQGYLTSEVHEYIEREMENFASLQPCFDYEPPDLENEINLYSGRTDAENSTKLIFENRSSIYHAFRFYLDDFLRDVSEKHIADVKSVQDEIAKLSKVLNVKKLEEKQNLIDTYQSDLEALAEDLKNNIIDQSQFTILSENLSNQYNSHPFSLGIYSDSFPIDNYKNIEDVQAFIENVYDLGYISKDLKNATLSYINPRYARILAQNLTDEEQIIVSEVQKSLFEFDEIEQLCKVFKYFSKGSSFNTKLATEEEILKVMMYIYAGELNETFDRSKSIEYSEIYQNVWDPKENKHRNVLQARFPVHDKIYDPLDSSTIQEYKRILGKLYVRIIDSLGVYYDSAGDVIPNQYNLECGNNRAIGSRPHYLKDFFEPNLSTEYVHYEMIMATQSFSKLINVEDQANWIADSIGTRSGPIETTGAKTIKNHRVHVDDLNTYITGANPGGMIVARDPFTNLLSGNTINAQFDSSTIHLANTKADFSQTLEIWKSASIDLSSVDFKNDSTQFTYDFGLTNAYVPIVTGNSITKQGSYLPDAEIMTSDGWVQFQDLKYGMKVAEVLADGSIKYTKPQEIYSTWFDGNVYTYTDRKTFSITVISDQELALSNSKQTMYKKKSSEVNVKRSPDGIALVDEDAISPGKIPILGSLPLKNNVFVEQKRYTGPLYCVNINNFTAHASVPFDATEVDMNELELHTMIDNAYTIPKLLLDETKRRFESKNQIKIDMSHINIHELQSNTVTFDFHNDDYFRYNASNVANTYPEVAPTEIFFFNSFQILGPTGPFGLSPSVQDLPRTIPRSLEHIILAQPDVSIGLTQQKFYEANPGAYFQFANTPNSYFAELGFENYQFSINEEFVNAFSQPISTLLIEQYQNYFELDENGRPIQNIVIENVSLNLANAVVSIAYTEQEDWQRNSSKLELVLKGDVTQLGTENDPRNRSIALSFETAIPAVQFKDNKPETDSKINLYNIAHYDMPDIISKEELYRYKDYGFDETVGINQMNRPEVMNDPRNRASYSILTLDVNPYQRSGKYRKLLYPFGFGSLHATFGNMDASFDLNTIYYEPGTLEVFREESYHNIVDLGNFKTTFLYEKPSVETDIHFAAEFNIVNPEVHERREWHWDFTYDLYARQEFITEGQQVQIGSSDYVVVDQEREFEMMTDATIDMPDQFIFEREMVITEYAYGVRKHTPLFDEYPTRWGSMDQSFDSNYRYPHKGKTFWDKTNFDVHIDHSLKENWYDFDYELTANNLYIDSFLLSGGIDPVSSYKDIVDTMKTVLEYDLEVKILNRWLFFDYSQKIRNDYRDWTKKFFDPYLQARSKAWLGDTMPSAKALGEPTIYLAPMEKKIPMVEYVETGIEGNTNFIDSTVNDEFYIETMGAFHVEDRNEYFQTSDIIKPWVRVRIYDWYKSKFADYFGDKIPTAKVTVSPVISTSFDYPNIPEYQASTTLIPDEANFIESGSALQDHEINFGGWRKVRDRNRLFALDREADYTLLNSQILNLFYPQEIVEYYKDALPGVEVLVEPKLQFRQELTANSEWGLSKPSINFDQIIYFPNTVFYDSTSDVYKQDHIKIDTSVVNRNTSFALRDVYHHRWGKRFIQEFMRTAIRLRDWGGDTIPSATAVPEPELEYSPQLYWHYGNKTGERYIDQQFEGVDYSHDISDYYIQDTIVYHPNTTFYDASTDVAETPEIESDFFVQDSFSTFGLSGVMDWRWYNVRIKEFMKKFIILRYWAEDTIPSVTVVEQPEIEYYPQLYFHYGKNADDQYIDEGFTGSNYSQDITDNYQIHETLIPDDAIRFDATSDGYTEVFPKSDMNIYNSYDVFALNKKILPFMNYSITPGQMIQQIKTWGGEAIPSVFARSWPEITYKPQLYGHYDNAITKNVDDSPESLIANKDVQKYYKLETITYLPNGTFLDATTDIEIPESQVFADTNVLDRNQFISVGDRVWGTDIINHQIKDYLLAELHEYNREHLPSVRAVSLPEITYKPQLYGHYKKSADQHVDDSPFAPIETQSIQEYYTADTILYDEQGQFAEAAFSAQLEFAQIFTEKYHTSDRFIIRGDELITNMFRDRIADFIKFNLVEKTPDITRSVKANTEGGTKVIVEIDTKNSEQMIEPFGSPFIEEIDTIFHNFGSMIDSGMYAEEVIVEYTKFDDMKVDEMFLNLNNEIKEDLLDVEITKRDLCKQTKADMYRAHHTVDASAYYVFSMYNEFGEDGSSKDILKTQLKEVETNLEKDAKFIDGSTHLERDYVFEFLNEVKNADRMIDLDQVFDVSMITRPILEQMDTFELTDNIRNHLKGSSIETLTEQMFEIQEFMPELNSNTAVMTEFSLENNTEAPFSIFSDPEIKHINSKMLKENDFLISKIMDPYLDVDIYRMDKKRIKSRKGKDFRSKFTNTSAKMNSVTTECFTWNVSQLNTFETDYEITGINRSELLEDFREII